MEPWLTLPWRYGQQSPIHKTRINMAALGKSMNVSPPNAAIAQIVWNSGKVTYNY